MRLPLPRPFWVSRRMCCCYIGSRRSRRSRRCSPGRVHWRVHWRVLGEAVAEDTVGDDARHRHDHGEVEGGPVAPATTDLVAPLKAVDERLLAGACEEVSPPSAALMR